MNADTRLGLFSAAIGRADGYRLRVPPPIWLSVYGLLAILACRDGLATYPATLPTGKPSFGVISLFNAWSVWWNADRLAHGLVGYWNAPIFWPEQGGFALSEPQPLTMLVAPVVWLFGPIAGYYAYFLMSLVLNGLFARRLILRLTSSGWIGGLAGAMVVWLPLIFRQPELLQYVALWPVLWVWDVALCLLDTPKMRHALHLGVALFLSFCASIHLGLFTVLILVGAWPWFGIYKSFRTWKSFVFGILTAGVLLLPLAVPMMRILSQHGKPRRGEVVAFLSASPGDWLRVPGNSLEAQLLADPGTGKALSPGWLRTALAILATASIPLVKNATTEEKRGVLFLSATSALAVLASLGPNLSLLGLRPWEILGHILTPLAHVRSPYRFAYLGQLAILLLAAIGVRRAIQWMIPLAQRKAGKVRALFITGMVVALAIFEIPPSPPFFVLAPDYSDPPGWVTYLANHAGRGEPVLLLDFPRTGQALEHERIVRAMLWQPIHRCPLVNGYAAFLPAQWCDTAHAWQRAPYSFEAFELLRGTGTKYLVRPPSFPPPPHQLPQGIRLEKVATDEIGYEVWEVSWGASRSSECGGHSEGHRHARSEGRACHALSEGHGVARRGTLRRMIQCDAADPTGGSLQTTDATSESLRRWT
jgi:hypothetical protein